MSFYCCFFSVRMLVAAVEISCLYWSECQDRLWTARVWLAAVFLNFPGCNVRSRVFLYVSVNAQSGPS